VGDLLGYARVLTGDQSLGLQLEALQALGCQRAWSDTAAGSPTERPELLQLLDHLRPGDTLVEWHLDVGPDEGTLVTSAFPDVRTLVRHLAPQAADRSGDEGRTPETTLM